MKKKQEVKPTVAWALNYDGDIADISVGEFGADIYIIFSLKKSAESFLKKSGLGKEGWKATKVVIC